MPDLDLVIGATRKLLSPAAPQVLALLGKKEPALERLRDAIELDPVLTVKIMDYANSSFYNRRAPVASLQRALVRLGWEASSVMLARLVMESATTRVDPRMAKPVWKHCVKMGELCRMLGKESGRVDPALAFTAGLVHAIGQLGLVSLLQDEYVKMWRSTPGGPHLARLERERLGFDHTRVGAGVLASMNVPEELSGAVRRMYKAHLAGRTWEGRRELPLAALLQLCQFLLYNGGARLENPAWLASNPLAQRLGVDTSEDLAGRFEEALNARLDEAA